MSCVLMNSYNRLPVSFQRGAGVWLYDKQNRPYLDAISGIAVCGLGHCHPELSAVIAEQAGELIHTSNLYAIEHQEALAQKLITLTQMAQVFFANSGAEANEAAIKLARLHGHRKGFERPIILTMKHAFHGRTMAALAATNNPNMSRGFTPMLEGFEQIPFNDLVALEHGLINTPQVSGVLLEPIQGEGGINTPAPHYLSGVRKLCDQYDALMMVDEVQTGNGRTGHYFAVQGAGVTPDVLTTAKGLGNGIPIGACLATPKAALFTPGSHASTFGGNPLACRVGVTVMELIEKYHLTRQASAIGARLREGLAARYDPKLLSIRGQGAMLGLKLHKPCAQLVHKALEQQLLINVTAESVVRLLPPLIMSEEETELLLHKLTQLLDVFFTTD